MTNPSDKGRALAALRQRGTFVCAVCGQSFEAWARKTQPSRTCSPKCRIKLHRQEHKKQEAPMPEDDEWCGLCGEPFDGDERRVDLMDGHENPFKAHERCAFPPEWRK